MHSGERQEVYWRGKFQLRECTLKHSTVKLPFWVWVNLSRFFIYLSIQYPWNVGSAYPDPALPAPLPHSESQPISRLWMTSAHFVYPRNCVSVIKHQAYMLARDFVFKTFQGKESCQQFQIIDVELTFYWEPVSPRSNAIALAALARVTSVWLDSYLRIRGRNLVLWVMRVFQPPLELISGIWCEKSVAVIIPLCLSQCDFLALL